MSSRGKTPQVVSERQTLHPGFKLPNLNPNLRLQSLNPSDRLQGLSTSLELLKLSSRFQALNLDSSFETKFSIYSPTPSSDSRIQTLIPESKFQALSLH